MSASEENEEEAPMSRSFSVEDLLEEVEKICHEASGAKVRDNSTRFFFFFPDTANILHLVGFRVFSSS